MANEQRVNEFTETFLVIARKIVAAKAAGNHDEYERIHYGEWVPAFRKCRRALGEHATSNAAHDAYERAEKEQRDSTDTIADIARMLA